MRRFLLKPLVVFLVLGGVSEAWAEVDSSAPLHVEADEVSGQVDSKVYARGHVVVTQDHQRVQADEVTYYPDKAQVYAQGQVIVTRDDQRLEADWVKYSQADGRIQAGERVRLERAGDVVTGCQLDYRFASPPSGQLSDVAVRLKDSPLRAEGEHAELKKEGEYAFKNARITTCAPDREDWYIRARTVDIDMASNTGVARDGRLEFFGVPLLYAPYLGFPVNNQRKSGVLMPTFVSRSQSGFEVTVPYYFNLAPNYDLTLSPRVLTRRGAMLNGEFRYLRPTHRGQLNAEYMPNDRLMQRNRYAVHFDHQHWFSPSLQFSAVVNRASDDHYFRHFGHRSNFADSVHLLREGVLTWQPDFGVVGQIRFQRYQTLQDKQAYVELPYARLPQITLGQHQLWASGVQTGVHGEFVDFSHPRWQDGQRLNVTAFASWPLRNRFGFVTPRMALNMRHYRLNAWGDQGVRIHRIVTPVFSVDSGVTFERSTHYFGRDAVQTLEPRLFYVHIPYRDQSRLPLFDTVENSFDFAQIFAENRFSGGDRLGDANALTAALTSRFIDKQDGVERLRVAVAQRFSFHDQRVTLTGQPDERKRSDFLASVGGQIWHDVWLNGQYQYNPQLRQTRRYSVDVRYQPAAGKTLSARYRYGHDELFLDTYRRDTLRQVDLAVQWPVGRNWYVVARENYSLRDRKSLEHLLGVEYHSSCWSLRMVGQQYVSGLNETSKNLFLQLELNGLGGLGTNPLETLRLAIPGYSKINESQGLTR